MAREQDSLSYDGDSVDPVLNNSTKQPDRTNIVGQAEMIHPSFPRPINSDGSKYRRYDN